MSGIADVVLGRLGFTNNAAHVDNERGPNGYANGGETQAYTDTAGTTSAITGDYVDVTCTTDAFIAIGNGTAALVAGGYFCGAGLTYRFPITSGVSTVSAIRLTASGTMYVHPVA